MASGTISGWSVPQILELAPDASGAKSGQGLAKPGKWSGLGRDERTLWGLCQGSGKDPYKTAIDLEGPAFKCSCPSRKLPCKHGIGLFLLAVGQPGIVPEVEPESWVCEWIDGRQRRAEAKASKPVEVDPVKVAKRTEARMAKAQAGMAELQVWLGDLVRRGIGNLPGEEYAFWDRVAARLVDAQVPGVAREVRDLAGRAGGSEGWQDRLLEALARLYLLAEATRRYESLSELEQADLRAALGIATKAEEVAADATPNPDRWVVLGDQVREDSELATLRTWLWGITSQRLRLILQFHPTAERLDRSLRPGQVIEADLIDYPSAAPSRALLSSRKGSVVATAKDRPTGLANLAAMLDDHARQVSANPWPRDYATFLDHVSIWEPTNGSRTWRLSDRQGDWLPLRIDDLPGWSLVAIGAEGPLSVLANYDGRSLEVISAWSDRQVYSIESLGLHEAV